MFNTVNLKTVLVVLHYRKRAVFSVPLRYILNLIFEKVQKAINI